MRLSLRGKILYSFLVASMLLMFTVAGIMYSNFSEIMFERASTDMSDLLVTEKNNLDLLVSKIKKCGDYIALNEYMTSTATQEKPDPILQNKAVTNFKREFQSIYELLIDSEAGEYVLNFYVNSSLPISAYLLDSSYAETVFINSNASVYALDENHYEDWMRNTMDTDEDLYIFSNRLPQYLFFAKKIDFINQKNAESFLGISLIGIDFGKMLRDIEKRSMFSNTAFAIIGIDNSIIIKSANAPPDDFILKQYAECAAGSYTSQGAVIENSLMNTVKSDIGLGLVSFTPVADITAETVRSKGIFVMAVSVGLLLLFFGSLLLSFVLSRPLRTLTEQVKANSAEPFQPLLRTKESHDEVDDLYCAINGLIERVNRLVLENAQQARREKELEFQMYQMRINPHFLYNSLDSIFWKAILSGEQGIADMASGLSKIFEYSVRGNDLQATLAEEVEMLQSYVALQSERFENQIRFVADLDGCSDIMIPKCLLQPLVENSIIHGMKEEQLLTIILRAETTADGFSVSIQDDGKGCSAERLNHFLSGQQAENDENGGMGILNVSKRIAFVYGSESRLCYYGNENGLTAVIEIKKNSEKGGNKE